MAKSLLGKSNKKIWHIVLLLFLIALPLFLLSYFQVTDSFLYLKLVDVERLRQQHFLSSFSLASTPAYDTEILTLSYVLNINSEDLQFLPIGGIVLVITYFACIKNIFTHKKDYLVLIILPLILLYTVSQSSSFYNIFLHAWAYTLYFTFILIFLILIKKETLRSIYICLLMLVFIASNSYYYTTTVWMVIFSVGYLIVSLLSENKAKITHNVVIAFFVIFLYFNQVFYKVFIPKLNAISVTEIVDLKISSFLQKFLATPPIETQYLYSSQKIFGLIYLLNLIVLLLPVIIYGVYVAIKTIKTYKNIKFGSLNIQLHQKLIFIFIITTLLDMLAYLSYGVILFKYIILIFPIVTYISIKNLGFHRYAGLALIVLLISNTVLFGTSFYREDSIASDTTYNDITLLESWMLQKNNQSFTILSDFDTNGKFFVKLSENNKYGPRFVYYDSKTYGNIILNNSINNIDYLIIDVKSIKHPVKSIYWRTYEPILKYKNNIDNNRNLNKVYDSSIYEVSSINQI